MQNKLKRTNDELELINKELEAFSYTVSHALRNHLNIINNITYLLNQKYGSKLDDIVQKYIQDLEDESMHMGEIIEDLWRLSESKSNYLEMVWDSFNLSSMVEKVVSNLRLKTSIKHKNFIIEPDIYVRGDQGLIKIALENLLDNANKFTATSKEPRIEFGKLEKDGQTVYFVKDNGRGFDPKKADKLFTPFHSLHQDEEVAGTGIGLATVKRIIERHGGKIWYDAIPNQGATFYFTLAEFEV